MGLFRSLRGRKNKNVQQNPNNQRRIILRDLEKMELINLRQQNLLCREIDKEIKMISEIGNKYKEVSTAALKRKKMWEGTLAANELTLGKIKEAKIALYESNAKEASFAILLKVAEFLKPSSADSSALDELRKNGFYSAVQKKKLGGL